MTELKVKKKNGSVEDFKREKLVNSLKKSGMQSEEKTEKIANTVTNFVKEKAEKGPVETSKIRGKVLEQMRTLNNAAAAKFENYTKSS
jgi:transcriptional regulator NrdR family protein